MSFQRPAEANQQGCSCPCTVVALKHQRNREHPFAKALTKARTQVIGNSREWLIAVENNQRRISKAATPLKLLKTTYASS